LAAVIERCTDCAISKDELFGIMGSGTGRRPRCRGTWSRDVQMIKAGISYKFESGVPPATTTFPMRKEKTPPSDDDAENLAKASQKPVATLVTVPFQNNAYFRAGPFNRTQDVLNIEPVVPMKLGTGWNVIARTIAPLMSQPDPVFNNSTDGIGDITEELFRSPANSGIKDSFWGLLAMIWRSMACVGHHDLRR
jgi:hypothetical protein